MKARPKETQLRLFIAGARYQLAFVSLNEIKPGSGNDEKEQRRIALLNLPFPTRMIHIFFCDSTSLMTRALERRATNISRKWIEKSDWNVLIFLFERPIKSETLATGGWSAYALFSPRSQTRSRAIIFRLARRYWFSVGGRFSRAIFRANIICMNQEPEPSDLGLAHGGNGSKPELILI